MGPEGNDTSGRKLLEAPVLNADTDKLKYRRNVDLWMSRVRVYAMGGDNRAKGVANGFGHTLYLAMDESYRKVIDAEIQDGSLQLSPDDQSESWTYEDQKRAVILMVNLVAKDSTAEAARRIINLSRKMFGCKRKNDESYSKYAERFRGVAQEYLNCHQHKPTEHEKQQTAMVLLENANLPDSVYNNLLSILTTRASSHGEPDTSVSIKLSQANQIKRLIENSLHSINPIEDDESHVPSRDTLMVAIEAMRQSLRAFNTAITRAKDRCQDTVAFNLDDTIEALRNIRNTDAAKPDTESSTQKTETESKKNAVIGSMLGGRSQRYDNERSNRKSYIPPGTGVKRYTRCAACNKKGHWARDDECPLNDGSARGRQHKRKYEQADTRPSHKSFRPSPPKTDDEGEDDDTNQDRKFRFFGN